jgi:hypothetical protein
MTGLCNSNGIEHNHLQIADASAGLDMHGLNSATGSYG